jgi:hypothetical protein
VETLVLCVGHRRLSGTLATSGNSPSLHRPLKPIDLTALARLSAGHIGCATLADRLDDRQARFTPMIDVIFLEDGYASH